MRVYLDFIRRRATGELQTGAEWMRTFVKAHPGAWDASRTRTGHGVRAATRLTLLSSRSSRHSGYSRDSRVTEAVAHDLLRACVDIGEGRRQEPALLGQQFIPPLRTDDAWCARRSSEDLGGPIGGASTSSLRPTASSQRPPPPSPRPSAGTCRWGGRATVPSK